MPASGIDSVATMHRYGFQVAIEARGEQCGVILADLGELLAQMAQRLRATLRRRIDHDELGARSECGLGRFERRLVAEAQRNRPRHGAGAAMDRQPKALSSKRRSLLREVHELAAFS